MAKVVEKSGQSPLDDISTLAFVRREKEKQKNIERLFQ